MKERPILFSAPMVRALLAGTKTQTRRVVKGVVEMPGDYTEKRHDCGYFPKSPYGVSGDRLWVRETWRTEELTEEEENTELPSGSDGIRFAADRAFQVIKNTPAASEAWCLENGKPSAAGGKWRPSIYMPRWASRITLEVTGVRIERLCAISEDDVRAEGVECHVDDGVEYWGPLNCGQYGAARGYRMLWESINGDGSWAQNPWVWVVEFKTLGHSAQVSM